MMKRHCFVRYIQSVVISDNCQATTSELIDILAHSAVLCYFLTYDMLHGPTCFKQSLSIQCRMETKILVPFEGASCCYFTRAFIFLFFCTCTHSDIDPQKISKQTQDK